MPTLSEDRIQRFLDHAQMSIHFHEHGQQARDPRYREILEFVDEIVDLLFEVRRERAALERIAAEWESCTSADPATRERMAIALCTVAREALGLPHEPGATETKRVLVTPAM